MSKSNDNLIDTYKKGYRVDDDGWVKSPKGGIISCSLNHAGYKRFTVRNRSGVCAAIFVHRLMAYQKYGDNVFKAYMQVRHLNGNPLDNSIDNIAIGTASENMMDIPASVRARTSAVAASYVIKYDSAAVRAIQEDRKNGMKYADIMYKYGISSKGTISYIINQR